MHDGKIHAVDNLTPLPFLHDKSRINQGLEMIGKRRCRHAQMLADLTDIQTIIPGAHQQSKDRQARVMTKSGKRKGSGGVFH